MSRSGAAIVAALLVLAYGSPTDARADASDKQCTITSLYLQAPTTADWEWPERDFFLPHSPGDWDVTLTGSATCTRPGRNDNLTASLSADAHMHVVACFAQGQGSVRINGTMRFTFASGLKDTREFSVGYDADLQEDEQPATLDIDGQDAGTLTWRYTYWDPLDTSFDRCRSPMSSPVKRIDLSGTFLVPTSKTTPSLFARVSPTGSATAPGHPDPIAASADGTKLYVGTFTTALSVLADRPPPSLDPSKVLVYDTATGSLARTYTITGQRNAEAHGLTAIALDSAGRLYVADVNPARVVRIDPVSGAQTTYATIPDFDESGQSEFGNRKPLPNGAAFGPDGSLYVTDTTQGVIWKVVPGGGTAQKWFSDPRLASFIGPNGIRLMADQKTLLFVVSNSQPPGALDGLQGKVYKLPITTTGTPGALATFWTGGPNEGPDSLAIAQSGNVYVAEAGDGARSGFVVLSPTGQELARRAAPQHRLTADVAYDTVADVAFVGTRAFFTNSSNFGANPANMAVFSYDVGDPGLPVLRPAVP